MADGMGGMLGAYRVLDLTNEKGFLAGKVLAGLGADVIKIEKPGGDPARRIGPFYKDDPDPQKSLYWWAFNTGKRGVTLDIESARGQEIFRKLVSTADVVLESFDPKYADSISLTYARLCEWNPRIVLTSITGFGHSGPYRDYEAPDMVLWALSGNAYLTGDPDRGPLAPSFPIAYLFGALEGAIGTLVALYHRAHTGKGQRVDAPAQLSLVWPLGPEPHGLWEQDKTVAVRQGRLLRRPQARRRRNTEWLSIPLIHSCKDGDVTFAALAGPGVGASSAALTGWMESEGMAGEALRGINWMDFEWQVVGQDVLNELADDFRRFFLTHTKAELFEEAQKRGIQLYPVFTPKDMLELKQLSIRNFWVDVEHPELGTSIAYPGAFFQSTETRPNSLRRAPLIGEHNEEIYSNELGVSAEELGNLMQSNVI